MITIEREHKNYSESAKKLIIAIQNSKFENGKLPTKHIVREEKIGIVSNGLERENKNNGDSVRELITAIQESKFENGRLPIKYIVREEKTGIVSKGLEKENINLTKHIENKTNMSTIDRSNVVYDDDIRITPLEGEAVYKIAEQGLSYNDYSDALQEVTKRQALLRKKVTKFLELSRTLTTENRRKKALDLFDKNFEDLIKIDAYVAKLHEYIDCERTR